MCKYVNKCMKVLFVLTNRPNAEKMKVDQVRDSVNCRVDEVRYFVKIVDVVRVDQVRVDQVGCSRSVDPSILHDQRSKSHYSFKILKQERKCELTSEHIV